MKIYNICWSGGIDSTMIVTQLSQYPVTIRPFYFRGQTFRLSEPQELQAISTISELLRNDPRTKANLLPLQIIEKDDSRIKDREIVKAHRRIYMQLLEDYKVKNNGKLPPAGSQQIYTDGAFISPQYIACGSLAKSLGENIEIGFLTDDLKGYSYLNFDLFKWIADNTTKRDNAYISEQAENKDLALIFKNILFPLIGQKMYKKDVWNWYAEHGYTQIRAKTHFCQAPVIIPNGRVVEPCGVCTSCIQVIREGVLEPFTENSLRRYRDYEENHEKFPEKFRLKGF